MVFIIYTERKESIILSLRYLIHINFKLKLRLTYSITSSSDPTTNTSLVLGGRIQLRRTELMVLGGVAMRAITTSLHEDFFLESLCVVGD